MPLVNAKEMLTKAKAGHYAVGQFNINNLEWTKAILLTAQELNSPVILGVSEGAGKYMCGYKTVVGMVNGMLEELASAQLCSMVLTIQSLRISKRQRNSLLSAMRRDLASRQKLVLSVVKKTALSVWVSVQTLTSASRLLTSA